MLVIGIFTAFIPSLIFFVICCLAGYNFLVSKEKEVDAES
jgi:hypothetical protein